MFVFSSLVEVILEKGWHFPFDWKNKKAAIAAAPLIARFTWGAYLQMQNTFQSVTDSFAPFSVLKTAATKHNNIKYKKGQQRKEMNATMKRKLY